MAEVQTFPSRTKSRCMKSPRRLFSDHFRQSPGLRILIARLLFRTLGEFRQKRPRQSELCQRTGSVDTTVLAGHPLEIIDLQRTFFYLRKLFLAVIQASGIFRDNPPCARPFEHVLHRGLDAAIERKTDSSRRRFGMEFLSRPNSEIDSDAFKDAHQLFVRHREVDVLLMTEGFRLFRYAWTDEAGQSVLFPVFDPFPAGNHRRLGL